MMVRLNALKNEMKVKEQALQKAKNMVLLKNDKEFISREKQLSKVKEYFNGDERYKSVKHMVEKYT